LTERKLAQERGEVVAIGRHINGVAATAGSPARVFRKRFLLRKRATQAAELHPHACCCRSCAAPIGGATRALGRPGGAHGWTPTLGANAPSLPPEGAQLAPWVGPAALMDGPPRLALMRFS